MARWAEQRAGDRADEIAELIATHLLEALKYLEELGETDERRADLQRSGFRWTAAAGARTMALWQRAEATRWFREAERLGDALDLPPTERAPLFKAHVRASWSTDPVAETERVLGRAMQTYETLGDAVGIGWANAHLVFPLMIQGRDEEAEAAGRTAIRTLEPLGEREELADALHMLGWYLWRRGRNEEAEALLRRTIEMADRLGFQLVHAEATQTLASCLLSQGRSAEAIETIEEAFRLAKAVGDYSNLMRSYNNLPATITELASDFPRAEAVLREGIELAQRSGSPPHEGWLTGSLGDVLFKLGELEEAERLQRRSLELAGIVGDEPLLGMRLSSLAFAIVVRGRIDEAERFQRESIPVLNANPEPQSQVFIPLVEGYLALARGDEAETITQFQATIEQLRAGSVETAPDVFTELVRTLIRSGRAAEAEAYRDLAERGRSPEARANAMLIDGLLSPTRPRRAGS